MFDSKYGMLVSCGMAAIAASVTSKVMRILVVYRRRKAQGTLGRFTIYWTVSEM